MSPIPDICKICALQTVTAIYHAVRTVTAFFHALKMHTITVNALTETMVKDYQTFHAFSLRDSSQCAKMALVFKTQHLQMPASSPIRKTIRVCLAQVLLCTNSTMTHHSALLLAAGQQRVLGVGIVKVQQGGQALAHNDVPINQGWYLAAGVQCHDLRALVLLCSTIRMVREPLHSCEKTKCAQQSNVAPECSDTSAQRGQRFVMKGISYRLNLLLLFCSVTPQ